MPNLNWLSWPVIDGSTNTVTLSLGTAGIAAGLLMLLLVLALSRAGFDAVLWALLRSALVIIVALAGWALLERLADRDRADERRALEERAQELTARATLPGSPLGCLDAVDAEAMGNSCEKALFAGPETVAAALAYVDARISLLADAADYVNRLEPSYSAALLGLRRAIENDRFGFVAQVLATREGCTIATCGQLVMVSDPARISANLKDRTFDRVLARYAPGWVEVARSAPLASPPPAGQPVSGAATGTAPAATSEPAGTLTSEPTAAPTASPQPPALPVPPRRGITTPRAPAPRAQQSPSRSTPSPRPSPVTTAGTQPRPP
jgi:hypothetical protein